MHRWRTTALCPSWRVSPRTPAPHSSQILEHAEALVQLKGALKRADGNPRVVVLEDSYHTEAFGPAIQTAASGLEVTSVRFLARFMTVEHGPTRQNPDQALAGRPRAMVVGRKHSFASIIGSNT